MWILCSLFRPCLKFKCDTPFCKQGGRASFQKRRQCKRMSYPIFNSCTLQECYPLRLKGLFCVNCPRLVETLLALTRPFLKSKLLSRIHILRNDYKKVHDLVPPQVLPPEFCGTHQEYDVDSLEAGLHSQRDYFEKIEKYGYDT